jgi:ABC-2 type transport system ATP-binding protein
MEGIVVVFDRVEKVYPGGLGKRSVTALRGISFTLEQGEVVAYVGPNGAGKTTSLNILLGHLKPTAGRVTVGGDSPENPATRTRIGYLPERPYFYEQLTALEFLSLCARLSGMRGATVKQGATSLLERLDLSHAMERKLRHYSRGMLQRLGLAQALIHEPELLVLDEPMGGLDPFGRKLVREIIAEARQQGRTVLYSSHILADAELVADRVGILTDGRLAALSTLNELRARGDDEYAVELAPSENMSMAEMRALWPEGRLSGGAWVIGVKEADLRRILTAAIDRDVRIVRVQAPQTPLEDALIALMSNQPSREV